MMFGPTVLTAESPRAGMRRETELLLCCARTCVDSKRAERIRALVREDIDWQYLIQTALGHSVMPLLYRQLKATCPEAVPKSVLDQLRHHFHANAFHNVFLANQLLKLLNLFEAHGIPAIPYKGPALAASIYGNVTLRQFGDLDILVRERDYQRAQHLLIDQGFQLTVEHEWETEFKDRSGRVAVDLHRRITPREFRPPIQFDYLWERLQPVALAGSIARTLCPEDTLLMLSIQITKDGFPSLAKICDIAELVRVHERLDWTRLLNQTRRLSGQRMVLLGLCLASKLLSTPLPREVLREAMVHRSIHQAVEHVSAKILQAGGGILQNQLTSRRFEWVVRERLRDKLCPHYLRYFHVVIPNEKDRALLPLPLCLSFLYYLLRPMRLFWEYGLRRLTLAAFRSFTATTVADAIVPKESNQL